MTTAHKVLLIVATALVVAGVALAGTAFALAGGDFRNLSTDQRHWEQCFYEVPADQVAALSAIEASDSEEIRVEGYDGDTIRIEYWENERRGMFIDQQDGTLLVNGDAGANGASWGVFVFSFSSEDHATRVLVPKSFGGDISVYGTDEGASVAGFERLGDVTVSSRSGSATANSLRVGSLAIESDNGLVQGNLVTADGVVSARASNGDISLGSILADELWTRNDNGSTSLADATAATLMSVSSQNGSIDLLRVDAPSVEASSANGSVELALPGKESDYALDAAAENGTVYAPTFFTHDADRHVTVRTDNGSITVDFEGGDLDEESVVHHGEALDEVLGIQREHGWVQPEGLAEPADGESGTEAESSSDAKAGTGAHSGEAGAGASETGTSLVAPATPATPAAPAAPAAPASATVDPGTAEREQKPSDAEELRRASLENGFEALNAFIDWVL